MPPTFFGPIFIHIEKSFEAYYYFFSTLLKLEPKLSNIVAVGTDGEQAIIKALRAVFGDSFISLRCFIHMKDNIKRKLTELLLPDKIKDEIIKDIFGFQQDALYVKGILDSESVAIFDVRFSLLKSKWDRPEQSVHPKRIPQVHEWIHRYETMVMKDPMIASVREAAGFGSPPEHYTTNRNECMNNVAKAHVDYHAQIKLVNNMYNLVEEQLKEVEKAVIGMGEYQFKLAYTHLEVSSSKWFSMSTVSRSRSLSVSPECCGITTVSAELLEATWKKAEKLLSTCGSI